MPRALLGILAATALFLVGTAASADLAGLVDRSDLDLSATTAITGTVVAADFVLSAPAFLDAVDLWLTEDGLAQDDVFGGFAGTLSWAIFTDGADQPGTLIAFGTDLAPGIQDAGFNIALGDVFRARVKFSDVHLDAGTYWLLLREGTWGTGDDGSKIRWLHASATVGDPSVTSPVGSDLTVWTSTGADPTFALYADMTSSYYGYDTSIEAPLNYVFAVDFTLAQTTTIGSAGLWLGDGGFSANGQLDGFSGVLSWALYADGGTSPGALLASGTDSAPGLFFTNEANDVARASLQLVGAPALAPGTYWFGVRDGAWGNPLGGSAVRWLGTDGVPGDTVCASDSTSATWHSAGCANAPAVDLSFALGSDLVFASGFESGFGCAWDNAVATDLCPPERL